MTEFFDRTLDNLRSGPLGPVVRWIEAHPRLTAWAVLGLGMVILLVIEARDVGLLPHQWAALIIATILTAGACIWIISWEDEEETTEELQAQTPAEPAEAASEAKITPKRGQRSRSGDARTPARKPTPKKRSTKK